MEEIIALSAMHYDDSNESNYGDCFLINTGNTLFIYDCGSDEHADEVIKYMNTHNFATAKFILSHNDEDHFKGLLHLLDEGKISKIYTTLLLKHVDDILDKIDDGRKTRESVKSDILEKYDNISKLSGYNLKDIYTSSNDLIFEIHPELSIIGPSYDYMISTVAKRLDGRESDIADGETAVNATSIQLEILFNGNKILLSGDSSFAAIEDKVRDYNVVQLPHHGKPKQANLIFEKKWDQLDDVYIVSDNTGNSNGGSDDLDTAGHRVYNTQNGPIKINPTFFKESSRAKATTGRLCSI